MVQDMEKKMEEKKMTYEELKMLLDQAGMQNKQLVQQMAGMNYTNLFKRLDYLFKVVENGSLFSSDFVVECTEEIESTLHLEEEEPVKEDK